LYPPARNPSPPPRPTATTSLGQAAPPAMGACTTGTRITPSNPKRSILKRYCAQTACALRLRWDRDVWEPAQQCVERFDLRCPVVISLSRVHPGGMRIQTGYRQVLGPLDSWSSWWVSPCREYPLPGNGRHLGSASSNLINWRALWHNGGNRP